MGSTNKDDYIRLHAALARVQARRAPDADLAAYRTYGVLPTHIHRSKAQHQLAVDLLIEALERLLPVHEPVVTMRDLGGRAAIIREAEASLRLDGQTQDAGGSP